MVNFFESLGILISPIWEFLGSYPFLLFAVTASFAIKSFFIALFLRRGLDTSKLSTPLIFLLFVLVGGMIEDIAWIARLLQNLFAMNTYILPNFIVRLSWAFFIVRYQALTLFIENLSEKNAKIRTSQLPFLIISAITFFSFIAIAIFYFNSPVRPSFEFRAMEFAIGYALIPLMIISLIKTLWKLRSSETPRIIKKQLKIFIQYLVLPTMLAEFIQTYPFRFFPTLLTHTNSVVGIVTITLTCAIYYSARKVMGLRFLNLYEHVRSPKSFDFIKDFKNVLEQFSHVTNERELIHITQNFFKEAFNIPIRRTNLYIRNLRAAQSTENVYLQPNSEQGLVEGFITANSKLFSKNNFIEIRKIIITDELAFSNFYDKEEKREKILHFLSNINADIFLPIYDKETLVAYIIIERYARAREPRKNVEFYSNIERDQMVVFATYLGNIIHLLQNRNLDALVAQEKELKEELYSKHQKINQYKESIRSFLRTSKEKKIGIIFYKNRRFTFGNQTAQELIQINVNTYEGHPISKALKQIAYHALEYKTQQTNIVKGTKGEKLVLSAIPNVEQNNVIITVYYPEISDILRNKMELLSDPTKWDYLLYLETTKSGKLIDELIPGNSEKLLNFKIDLLKISLNKKAILLDMPEEDLLPTVELLHHISLRETLSILHLQRPSNDFDCAIKIFGINSLFGLSKNNEIPLLQKLDKIGTLFIQNIHLISLEAQEYLAEFIKYGIYRIFKSDQKVASNVRIICSSNKNLQEMVTQGTFSKALFLQLNKTTLAMPSLVSMSEDELKNIATSFSQQAIKSADAFKNLLELTEKEKGRLANTRPTSLHELKMRVQQILEKKSKTNDIHEEAQIDPAFNISDPELAEAARLGKHALKDQKTMTLLWNKFKNQNKIATFLGVNRSSVNRRCKKYQLDE